MARNRRPTRHTALVIFLLLALGPGPAAESALAADPSPRRESPSPARVVTPADRLAFTARTGHPAPGGTEAAYRDAGDGEERLQAALVLPSRAWAAPYVGVNGRSLPQPDKSAGIATPEVETVDMTAMAGVRFLAGQSATVRLFLTVGSATLDERNRLATRLDAAPADIGLAWSLRF